MSTPAEDRPGQTDEHKKPQTPPAPRTPTLPARRGSDQQCPPRDRQPARQDPSRQAPSTRS